MGISHLPNFIVKSPEGLDSDRWIPMRGGARIQRGLGGPGFSQHLECGIHRSESSPEGSFALIPHPVARWAKIRHNNRICAFTDDVLTIGAQKSNVYKRDVFVTSWRFHNRAWQPQRHDRLSETSGTLWIHRGALTIQRCSLATGCGIKRDTNNRNTAKTMCIICGICYITMAIQGLYLISILSS